MKIYRRIISVLLVMQLLSTAAYAAGIIDLNRDVRLTISYQDGNTPLAGAEFGIYLVATVDESGDLTATDAFKQFNVDIRGENDEAWKALASTLEGYVLRDNIAPTDSGETNADGYLYFPTGGRLTPGLYLVLGHRHIQDGLRYDPMPFMVMLPTQDTQTGDWLYEVIVDPKHESSEVPNTPSAITRKVLKVWDDDDSSDRPTEVVVQLLRNGEIYDTATLNAENNWRYTWSDLDDSYTWTVVEKECKGYTVRVERDGITFVITNTRVPETPVTPSPAPSVPVGPSNPSLPQTGQVWWPVPVLLMCGLLFIIIGLICRRRSDSEM